MKQKMQILLLDFKQMLLLNRMKEIAKMVFQTTDGQRVPIQIKEIKNVGFKKEWWQFWKK